MFILSLFFYSFFVMELAAPQCTSGVRFIRQPPQFLPCNPVTTISLSCEIGSETLDIDGQYIRWHYFGLGTNFSIVINDVSPYSTVESGGISLLSFMVRPSTYGVYWCTVEGYATPSAVRTLICPSTINTSSDNCSNTPLYVASDQCVHKNETSAHSYAANMSDIFDQCTLPLLPPSSSSSLIINSTNGVTASTSTFLSSLHYTINTTSTMATTTPGHSMLVTQVSSLPYSSPPLSQESNTSRDGVNVGPNPILIILTIVCILLGCVAALIIVAIVILCCLTKRGKYATSREDEGNMPPTVDPIRHTHTDTMLEDGASQSTCTTCTNGSPPLQPPEEGDNQPVSFSNPVYEMAVPTVAQVATPTASQLSLNPPKHLPPQSYSPTPPIFSEDESDEKRRSYYTKPDLSKKRSHSVTPQEISQPPSAAEEHSLSSANTEVMYDTPVIVNTKPDNNSAIYSSPTHLKPKKAAPAVTSDPNYDTPWEKLPIALKRSRESTRSHSCQRDSSVQPTINNNNTKTALFDDPAYDIPTV